MHSSQKAGGLPAFCDAIDLEIIGLRAFVKFFHDRPIRETHNCNICIEAMHQRLYAAVSGITELKAVVVNPLTGIVEQLQDSGKCSAGFMAIWAIHFAELGNN